MSSKYELNELLVRPLPYLSKIFFWWLFVISFRPRCELYSPGPHDLYGGYVRGLLDTTSNFQTNKYSLWIRSSKSYSQGIGHQYLEYSSTILVWLDRSGSERIIDQDSVGQRRYPYQTTSEYKWYSRYVIEQSKHKLWVWSGGSESFEQYSHSKRDEE
jgi:hypothetical protein